MALTRTDETEILTALHDGIHERPLWGSFLDRLRRRAQADWAALILRAGQGTTILHDGRGAMFDPGALKLERLRTGRVYAGDELIEYFAAGDGAGSRTVLEGAGARFCRVVRVAAPGGANGWLVLARAEPEFPASVAAILGALAAHLEIALRNRALFENAATMHRVGDAALAAMGIGWVAVDEQGRSLYASETGEGLMAESGVEGAFAPLAQAILHQTDTAERATTLAEQPRLRALAVQPAPAPATALSAGAAAVILLRQEQDLPIEQAPLVARWLGLSMGEARLALLLANGRSLAEAAAALKLTIETARNYSKRIYAKANVRGQAELVRAVLNGLSG